jgi:hypothetical protein
MTKTLKLACVVVSLVCAMAVPALANTWTATFENGLGQDQIAIAQSIPGLTLTTLTGAAMHYVDVTTGIYNATSGDGTIYEGGEYFVGGSVAAAVWNLSDMGKVSFDLGPVSVFRIGYSSQYAFQVQAYDSRGVQIATTSGAANTRGLGGTGLGYLQISRPTADIAYVVFGNNYGGYWAVDNVTTDAPLVPEPGSILILVMGAVGLLARVKVGKS